MSEGPLLCILVDALRHDYLDTGSAPALQALADRHGTARMRPILGYSDSIRATLFTGAYPDEHGYWMEYCRRPAAGPMEGLARLAWLDRFPEVVRRAAKIGLSQTAVRSMARRKGYAHLSLRNLPFRSLRQFDWTLRQAMTDPGALGTPTLFDELSQRSATWRYLDSTKLSRRRLVEAIDAVPDDTVMLFVYLHQIDMASHVVGLDSRLFWRSVAKTDAHAGAVVQRFARRFPDHRLLVFSDHGMSKVARIVAYPELWRHPRFPKDFCFALDATMVRLWFDDADARLRSEIRRRVQSGAPGRFLSAEERRELHLDFQDRLYGDEIYLLEPGTAIYPNFHSLQRPKAMHAYHPDDPDQHGIFITSEAFPQDVAELTDVTDVCRTVLGLPDRPLADAHAD